MPTDRASEAPSTERDPASEHDPTHGPASSSTAAISADLDEASPPPSLDAAADREQIGRFTVLGRLGAGGMGVVVAAIDPTLNRKVAIKVLHGEHWRAAVTLGRSRLVAEAQAMAKLSHPNVVTLHEIGFDDEGAFLVMDHVAGTTLRGWLDESRRSWREIVAMFVAAGEGLAAAHREGISHRDFKPDNVLVGRDGRARVTDFGIAALAPDSAQSIAGTPSYMAPEQLRGEPCDARADQFAFCVALWEALHGARPFAGASMAARLAEIEAGRALTPDRPAPRWLRTALRRGLAADPARRWPSLADLLDVLRRRARTGYRAALAALVLAGVALLLWQVTTTASVCASSPARLVGVWDATRKAIVRASFVASGAAYADDEWRLVQARLDRFATDWQTMATAACRATRVEHRQSDAELDLRMSCLEQRRNELAALSASWLRGVTRETLEHASDAIGGLTPVSECADLGALTQREPASGGPIQASLIAFARTRLALLQADVLAYRLRDARHALPEARAAVEATRWAPLRAQLAIAEGELLVALRDSKAEAQLLEASQLADRARDDRLRSRALVALAESVAATTAKPDADNSFLEIAEGVLARHGDDQLRVRLLIARAKMLIRANKLDDARRALEEAYARSSALLGPGSPEAVAAATSLARLLNATSDHEAAKKIYEQTIPAARQTLGANHPQLARTMAGYGRMLGDSGDLSTGAAVLQQALAAAEQAFGTDSPDVASILTDLGGVLANAGRPAEAQPYLRRALAIRERAFGPEHPAFATALANASENMFLMGDTDAALPGLQRALAIRAKAYGASHYKLAPSHEIIGRVYEEQRDLPRALASFQLAQQLFEISLSRTSEDTLRTVGSVGRVLARLGRCSEAIPLLARTITQLPDVGSNAHFKVDALAARASCELAAGQPARALASGDEARKLGDALHLRAEWLAIADGARAQAMWALGRHNEAAQLMQQAAAALARDKASARAAADARAWLAAHGQGAR